MWVHSSYLGMTMPDVKRLEHQQRHEILQQLQSAVTVKEKERKKKLRVFEILSDIKPCYKEKFLLQKLGETMLDMKELFL